MKLTFGVKDWEHTPHIHVEELVNRLVRRFPGMIVDRAMGNAYVRNRLDELRAMGAPDVILTAHRNYFDNVIYASISEPDWNGAIATSYLHSIWPGCGDVICVELTSVVATEAAERIANELEAALEMEIVKEIES